MADPLGLEKSIIHIKISAVPSLKDFWPFFRIPAFIHPFITFIHMIMCPCLISKLERLGWLRRRTPSFWNQPWSDPGIWKVEPLTPVGQFVPLLLVDRARWSRVGDWISLACWVFPLFHQPHSLIFLIYFSRNLERFPGYWSPSFIPCKSIWSPDPRYSPLWPAPFPLGKSGSLLMRSTGTLIHFSSSLRGKSVYLNLSNILCAFRFQSVKELFSNSDSVLGSFLRLLLSSARSNL